MGRLTLLCLFAYGCGTPEYRACEDMCKELVRTCAYAAFPTTDSCMRDARTSWIMEPIFLERKSAFWMRNATPLQLLNVKTATVQSSKGLIQRIVQPRAKLRPNIVAR